MNDRFEPNNSLATATVLLPDSLYAHLAICDDDRDHFSVTIEDTFKLTARTVLASGSDVSWMIYWLNAAGRAYATLGTGGSAGETETFFHTFLPGTYYLQLWESNEDQKVVYDVAIDTGAPCVDDEYEDNDFDTDAKTIVPGFYEGLTGCYVDADWYAVSVEAGQTIILTVDTHDYTYLRRLGIVEPGGAQEGEVYNGEAVSSISLVATSGGTAKLSMMVWQDAIPYDMTVSVED